MSYNGNTHTHVNQNESASQRSAFFPNAEDCFIYKYGNNIVDYCVDTMP